MIDICDIANKMDNLIIKGFDVWHYDKRNFKEIAKQIVYIVDNKEKYRKESDEYNTWYKNRTLIREYLHEIFRDLDFNNVECKVIDNLEYRILSFIGNSSKVILNRDLRFKYNIDYVASINNDKETILSDEIDYKHYYKIDYDMLEWLLQYKYYSYLIELLDNTSYYSKSIFRDSYNTIEVMKAYLNKAEKIYRTKNYLSLTFELDEHGEWIYKYLLNKLTDVSMCELIVLINNIDSIKEEYLSKININIHDYIYRQRIGMDKDEIYKLGLREQKEYNLYNIFKSNTDGKFFIETMIRKKMYGEL